MASRLFSTTLKKQDTTPKNVTIYNRSGAHLSLQRWEKCLLTDCQDDGRFPYWHKQAVCLPTAGQGHRMWEDVLGVLAAAHTGKQFRTDGQGSQPPVRDLVRDFSANLCASLGHTSFPLTLTPSHSPGKLMTMKRWHWSGLQPVSPGMGGWTTGFCLLPLDGIWRPRIVHLVSSYLFMESSMSLNTFLKVFCIG